VVELLTGRDACTAGWASRKLDRLVAGASLQLLPARACHWCWISLQAGGADGRKLGGSEGVRVRHCLATWLEARGAHVSLRVIVGQPMISGRLVEAGRSRTDEAIN